MKKLMISALSLLMLSLCACSFSASSTSSFSTSVTADGKTTTTETVIENGQTSTSTFTTSEEDPTGLRSKWLELFNAGAEGRSNDGYDVYFIYNTGEDNESSLAAIMVTDPDSGELLVYEYGEIEEEDDHLVIYDVEGEESIPFVLDDENSQDGFTIFFQNDDNAFLEYTDVETMIDHMISIWEQQRDSFQARKESEAE